MTKKQKDTLTLIHVFFLPPVGRDFFFFFSLPWREGVRGRGFLRNFTLSLSRQGRGKKKEELREEMSSGKRKERRQ